MTSNKHENEIFRDGFSITPLESPDDKVGHKTYLVSNDENSIEATVRVKDDATDEDPISVSLHFRDDGADRKGLHSDTLEIIEHLLYEAAISQDSRFFSIRFHELSIYYTLDQLEFLKRVLGDQFFFQLRSIKSLRDEQLTSHKLSIAKGPFKHKGLVVRGLMDDNNRNYSHVIYPPMSDKEVKALENKSLLCSAPSHTCYVYFEYHETNHPRKPEDVDMEVSVHQEFITDMLKLYPLLKEESIYLELMRTINEKFPSASIRYKLPIEVTDELAELIKQQSDEATILDIRGAST